MSEEIKMEGEATKPIDQVNVKETPDFQKMIADAIGENDKKWQGRFDKVLSEKKQTETKALTVEERMAQLEAERDQERLAWTRKENKMQAGIDDAFHAAMIDYSSVDPDKIMAGALQIKAILTARETESNKKIAALEQKLKYGDKAPPAGYKIGATDFSKMSLDEATNYAKQGPEFAQELMAWRQQNRRQ